MSLNLNPKLLTLNSRNKNSRNKDIRLENRIQRIEPCCHELIETIVNFQLFESIELVKTVSCRKKIR